MSPVLRALALALSCGTLATACPGTDPAVHRDDPGAVALEVFRLSREPPIEAADLDRCFGAGGTRGSLLDVLEAMTSAGEAELVALERSPGASSAFADVDLPVPGGGRARYELALERGADARWRVVWLAGPGLEWPPRSTPVGSALSVSAHPAGAGER